MEDVDGGIIIAVILGNAVREILEAIADGVSFVLRDGEALHGLLCAVVESLRALAHAPLVAHGACGNGQGHDDDKSQNCTTVHLSVKNE